MEADRSVARMVSEYILLGSAGSSSHRSRWPDCLSGPCFARPQTSKLDSFRCTSDLPLHVTTRETVAYARSRSDEATHPLTQIHWKPSTPVEVAYLPARKPSFGFAMSHLDPFVPPDPASRSTRRAHFRPPLRRCISTRSRRQIAGFRARSQCSQGSRRGRTIPSRWRWGPGRRRTAVSFGFFGATVMWSPRNSRLGVDKRTPLRNINSPRRLPLSYQVPDSPL